MARPAREFALRQTADQQCDNLCALLGSGSLAAGFIENLHIERMPFAKYFDWSRLFIAAAGAGDLGALNVADAKWPFAQQETLNRALAASIECGDNPTMAHHLVIMGAQADAVFKGETLIERAATLKRAGAFEEMVLWADAVSIPANALAKVQDDGAFDVARQIIAHREIIAMAPKKELQAIYIDALEAEDAPRMMATFAESRRSYFCRQSLRGEAPLKAQHGFRPGDGILLALIADRPECALQMIRDGYAADDVSWRMINRAEDVMPEAGKNLYVEMNADGFKPPSLQRGDERRTTYAIRMAIVETPYSL